MLTATIKLRADTLPDFNSVLEIIKQSDLPVSIEEVILHQQSGPYFGGNVKAPSVMKIEQMLLEPQPLLPAKLWDHAPTDEEYLAECIRKGTESWKGVDVNEFMDQMRGRDEEEHF